ncbi:tachykinin-4 [Peromyscus californicus insignis]|uniref:tachykinin-4 n=1 Tax=Peromyscus californicus insignis TaxID=564181 RepID=UPI0022A6FAB7|nr:tachykinin-4 [Peromyscus californicus insignis]
MLPLLALCLLIGPSVCRTAGDREERTLGTEAESWVTVNLKGIPVASIELQLQETKSSRTRQFYGLMGKRVEGTRPIQPRERMGYQLGRIAQDLLGARGLSIEGRRGHLTGDKSIMGKRPGVCCHQTEWAPPIPFYPAEGSMGGRN